MTQETSLRCRAPTHEFFSLAWGSSHRCSEKRVMPVGFLTQ
jgi:hypothetical protein